LALPDLSTRLSNTDQLLVRSGMEIGRLLAAMCKDGDTVSGNVPPEQLFLSRLLSVEPQKGVLRLAYSDHKPVNSAVLQSRSLTLRCNHRGALFAFAAATPRHAAHGGAPCIECGLPTAILGMQQRRGKGRVLVPAQAPVQCELRMDMLSFAARVVDVSLDGLGILLTDPAIPICAGTRLQNARIRHPQSTPFLIDLEICYVTRVQLPNGQRASRVGCRVLGERAVLESLIRLFVIDLA
jgi:c-di-GMP-binding flagellar brake protein YcgR